MGSFVTLFGAKRPLRCAGNQASVCTLARATNCYAPRALSRVIADHEQGRASAWLNILSVAGTVAGNVVVVATYKTGRLPGDRRPSWHSISQFSW